MPTHDSELAALLGACRLLLRSILSRTRTEDDAGGWTVRLRTAKKHVDKAIMSLSLDEDAVKQMQDVPAGEVDRITASLTAHLVHDLLAEVDREHSAEVDERMAPVRDRDGFHGYNWAIPLPELMGFLQVQQKSGVLRVNTGGEVISLVFDGGDLIHASSDNSPPGMRLGELLVSQSAIDMLRLEHFLLRYGAAPGRLGDALEAAGLITKAALRRALDSQVAGIFQRLFHSRDAYYAFREGHSVAGPQVRRNVCQLLLETCRVRDESQRKSA
ncbi:MAG: DUF4388 domain-containing protein [Planctomycetes bacterium]|nr:DUF4388 domain-containing protein [Planctomycetota bacterium]